MMMMMKYFDCQPAASGRFSMADYTDLKHSARMWQETKHGTLESC